MQRLNYMKQSPEFFKKLMDLNNAIQTSDVDKEFHDLVTIRASQMNGCGFCLDMHVKEAKIHGERELRVHHLAIWRESSLFSLRERAALEWTEAVTHLPPHGISNEVYASIREHLSEKELSDLTFSIMMINAWNRLGISFKPVLGSADAAFGLDKAGLH
jgi:AhpD family alkylhydroperoxidase